MNDIIQVIHDYIKKYSLFIIGGAIGSVIHRLRTKMSFKQFIGSIIISVFVALSVGIICKNYFKLHEDIIFVLCGISGTFSKIILDEIEEIISSISNIIKNKMNL